MASPTGRMVLPIAITNASIARVVLVSPFAFLSFQTRISGFRRTAANNTTTSFLQACIPKAKKHISTSIFSQRELPLYTYLFVGTDVGRDMGRDVGG